MALSWARKRQFIYISIILVVFLLIGVVLYFWLVYSPPSCFDGEQNQNEVGVDCGGVCERICVSQARPLNVLWAHALPVTDSVYNAVAYIENANPRYEVREIAYEFRFYGPNGTEVARRSGVTFVPRNMRIGIFEESVQSNDVPIVRTEFTFIDEPTWYRDTTPDPEFKVEDKVLSREDTTPRVQARLINTSVKTLRDIDAVAIVYDDFGNPIAASRTFFERLAKGESHNLTYTWPRPYTVGERICEVPVDTMLVVDRSGSMNDDQAQPPQPLTDVKHAAQTFVDTMQRDDKVGVVSFATQASDPIDAELTFDHRDIKNVLSSISIGTNGIQHTNMADGVSTAAEALVGGRATSTARHAVVVLTDGVATHPKPPADTEVDEFEYAEDQALSAARVAKRRGYQVYTIGLGEKVNPEFLREMASTPDHFFEAPTSEGLEDVYTEIANSICKLGPKVIEIIPRLPAAQY